MKDPEPWNGAGEHELDVRHGPWGWHCMYGRAEGCCLGSTAAVVVRPQAGARSAQAFFIGLVEIRETACRHDAVFDALKGQTTRVRQVEHIDVKQQQ